MPNHEFLIPLLCLLPLAVLILMVFVAIWVYRDAESRGMSGVLWLIVILVGGIIGLIIYFVVREPKRPAVWSPMGYAPYAAYTGPPPPVALAHCRHCGGPVPPGSRFCPRCGGAL